MDTNVKLVRGGQTDPTGKSQHEKGAKLDGGKPRPALLISGFSAAFRALDEVMGGFLPPGDFDQNWALNLDSLPLIAGQCPHALLAVADVSAMGAAKYTDNGWEIVPNAVSRYTEAFYRHAISMQFEARDVESGFPHLAHALWNQLAVLELRIRTEQCSEALIHDAAECILRSFQKLERDLKMV